MGSVKPCSRTYLIGNKQQATVMFGLMRLVLILTNFGSWRYNINTAMLHTIHELHLTIWN